MQVNLKALNTEAYIEISTEMIPDNLMENEDQLIQENTSMSIHAY